MDMKVEVDKWLSSSVNLSHFITLHFSYPMTITKAEKSIRHFQRILSRQVTIAQGKKTPRKLMKNLRMFGAFEQSHLCKNSNKFDHLHILLEESLIDDNKLRSIIKSIWSKMDGTRPFQSMKKIKIIEAKKGNNSICNIYPNDDCDFDSSQLHLVEGLSLNMEESEDWFKKIESLDDVIGYILKDYHDEIPSELIAI